MKKILVLGALALCLTGCSSINSGTVTAKVHEPANTYYITSCTTVGKITTCTPIPQYDDEDWRLDLKKGDETGYIYVTEDTFNKIEVGDYMAEPKK